MGRSRASLSQSSRLTKTGPRHRFDDAKGRAPSSLLAVIPAKAGIQSGAERFLLSQE